MTQVWIPSVFGNGPVPQADTPRQALELLALIKAHPGQRRPSMRVHAVLMRVAQARADDLARRNYLAHITPEGLGPNEIVKRAGYELPHWYGRDRYGVLDITANNIESLHGGALDADMVIDGWMHSDSHRPHMLGEGVGYNDHADLGVGYCERKGTVYTRYWCFISGRH